MKDSIVIERTIDAPIERVFDAFITPEDLKQWHHAGEGWQTPYAEVDPRVGGKQKIAYADAKGTVEFELVATFTVVDRPNRLVYTFDGREVSVDFETVVGGTKILLELEIEDKNSKELQLKGWTEHIDNLDKYLGDNL